jgi:hypothetical protein
MQVIYFAYRAAHIAALKAIEQLENKKQNAIPIESDSSDTESDTSIQFEVNEDFMEFYKKSLEYKLLKSL